jgi:hypothetical protein
LDDNKCGTRLEIKLSALFFMYDIILIFCIIKFFITTFYASQVLDNHVIRYIPPEEYVKTSRGAIHFKNKTPLGCLVVGAEATNPEKVKH